MKKKLLYPLIFILLSCSQNDDTGVEDFLNSVVDIMERNSINRNTIDWLAFRNEVLSSASDVQRIEGTNGSLRIALGLLADNHSFIIRPNGTTVSSSNLRCSNTVPVAFPTNGDIGYIKVSPFSGTDNDRMIQFAQDIQNDIRNQDQQNMRGWIVDLRGNTGGNMWPMLAGIGPLLGEEVVGFFIGPNGNEQFWDYNNGASRLNQSILVKVPNPYSIMNQNAKVAVLLNNSVISSGEAIAVAFIGNENTQSFGEPTCGLSTSNSTISLSDGSTLFLTTAFFADREKNIYGGPLEPDVIANESEIIDRALEYLTN